MPALGLAVEPLPPLGSAEPEISPSKQDELTTQLQGLHQLHIQLETAIAFLEGREPHGVPLFQGEFQDFISNNQFATSAASATTTTTSSGASPPSPQSAARSQQQFTDFMSQISGIQRDFGKLKLQQRQQRLEEKGDGSSSSSSSYNEIAEEEKEKEVDLQDDNKDSSTALLSSSSSSPFKNEDSNSVTSFEGEESLCQQKQSKSHPRELKLLLYHKSSEIESENSDTTSTISITSGSDIEDSATITAATTAATLDKGDAHSKGEESSTPSSATLRLQLLQARRQLESRGREIARLQDVVQNLEAKVVSAAAPKAVMAQAAEMQKKYTKLEIQLRNAELDASEANCQVSTLRKAAKDREKEFANMKKPSEVAVEHWQEGKKLQKRIEFLQTKLQQKSKETETATKAQEMLQCQVNRLNNELTQSRANSRNLLSKLEKQELKYNGGPGGKKNVPGTVVQKLMEEMETLQERYDALERQVAATQGGKQQHTLNFNCAPSANSTSQAAGFYSSFSAPVSPNIENGNKKSNYCPSRYAESSSTLQISSVAEGSRGNAGSVARDLKILDLELERDQAKACAARLQQRLQFVLKELGQTYNCEVNESKGSPYLTKQDRRRSSIAKTNKGSSLSGGPDREKELLDTISLLKSALEKTRKGLENGVSSAKYMQAVEKAKLAAERVKELEAAMKDAEMHRERVLIAQREAADAQVMISALRGQLRVAKRRGKENAAARDEIINAQIAELERALRERDAELAALKHSACDEARALVAEGLTPKMVVNELLSARAELAAALEREEVLKRELAPFDAVFFAELHQLKREHEELRLMCASYQNRTK